MERDAPRAVRWSRRVLYAAAAGGAVAIAAVARIDAGDGRAFLVEAREFFGLWALGLVLASVAVGPLTSVFPRIPLRAALIHGRRALGVSAGIFAAVHVSCYLGPLVGPGWRNVFKPGASWIAGLVLGLVALSLMSLLVATSRDRAVTSMGGARWKRLHRVVYAVVLVAAVHAFLNGSDFGFARPLDVPGEHDAGALVGFSIAIGAWVALFVLRRRKVRFGEEPRQT